MKIALLIRRENFDINNNNNILSEEMEYELLWLLISDRFLVTWMTNWRKKARKEKNEWLIYGSREMTLSDSWKLLIENDLETKQFCVYTKVVVEILRYRL